MENKPNVKETQTPVIDENKLVQERIEKLNLIRQKGINPYPYRFKADSNSLKLRSRYDDKLESAQKTTDYYNITGRIMLMRNMGKVCFITLQDQFGKIQLMLRSNTLNEKYDLVNLLDLGDIIGAYGFVMKTRTGELTLNLSDLVLLSKAIRPMPEKFHGLKDPELRYRMRYLDLVMNPDVKKTFVQRSKIYSSIRRVLDKDNFLEVQTPILQPVYGGASAKPFVTHLNSLHMDVYLRISDELYLKRLLVGGMEKVYEFSTDFRNEGIDRTHNPEFTQIEIYQAYADYSDMMILTQKIISQASLDLHGTTKVKLGEHNIDLTPPFKVMTMKDAVKEYSKIDIDALSDRDLMDVVDKHKLDVKGHGKGEILVALFEKYVEEKLIQPTFITQHPKESTPLCKLEQDNPEYVERFELFVAGFELANAYSELNDPVLQRKLLEEQAKQLRGGSEESHPMDEDFVRAVEYGMPPAGGVGIGIDRLAMLLTNNDSIREVILFPFMKHEVKE